MILELSALGLAALAQDHGSTPFDELFTKVGAARNVPANLLRAIAHVESGFNPGAVSASNDYGIMQVNADNLRAYDIDASLWLDPETSIDTGAHVIVDLQRELGAKLNPFNLAMAYNVGPDLQPRAAGEAYAVRVLWHWLLYDVGRLGRS